MNSKQLQRTLRLLRKTGDRGIILDQESDEVFVLMDADEYEMLLNVENDKDDENGENDEIGEDDFVNPLHHLGHLDQFDHTPHPVAKRKADPLPSMEEEISKLNFEEDWTEKKLPILNEESLTDVPHDEEDEEKFYLEPVE